MKKILVCFILSLSVQASAQSIRQTRSGGGGGGGSCIIDATLTGSCATGLGVNLVYGFLEGAGTTGTIPKYTGMLTLGDSLMTELGSTITVAGYLQATGLSANDISAFNINGNVVTANSGAFGSINGISSVDSPIGNFDTANTTTTSAATAYLSEIFADTATVTHVMTDKVSALEVSVGALNVTSLSGMITLASGPCPTGWGEYIAGQGLYIVGVPGLGTVGGTVGTGLTNLQNPSHTHTVSLSSSPVGSGTGPSVYDNPTSPITTSGKALGDIAPYIQLRLCIIP